MKKIYPILLGLAIFGPVIWGCANPQALSSVEVVSVKLVDWRNPDDGKTYVVAMPTWKNAGSADLQQVMILAEITAENAPDIDQPKEPQFFGAPVEPGTVVTGTRLPEDGVVLGLKEKLGNLKPEEVRLMGVGSPEPYVPQSDPPA